MESSCDDTEVLLATPSTSARKNIEGKRNRVKDDLLCVRSSRFCCQTVLVEPVILLVFLSLMGTSSIKTQFIYHSVAKELDPNNTAIDPNSIASLCNVSNMSDHRQDAVQKRTAYYSLTLQLMYSIPNMIGGFIVGSLSDAFGRRIGLCVPILGQGLSYAAVAAVIILDLPLYAFYFTDFVGGISGNVFPVAAAYLADASAESSRTFRMSVLDVGLFLTIGMGIFAYNEWLQIAGGIRPVMFVPILTLMTMAFVYVAAFLKETVVDDVDGASRTRRRRPTAWESVKKCSDLFYVDDDASVSFSSARRRRWNVPFLLLFAVFLCAQLSYAGRSLENLFLMNHPLCWEPRQLGVFAMAALFLYSLATLFSTKCLVRIPLVGGDVFLLFLSLASGAGAFAVLAFVRHSWMAWLYVGVGAFKIVCFPVLRSMMSKTAPPASFGSLYASISVVESAVDLIVNCIFSFIYAETLSWFPGFIFLIISLGFVVAICFVVVFNCFGHGGRRAFRGDGEGRADEDGGAYEYRIVDASSVET